MYASFSTEKLLANKIYVKMLPSIWSPIANLEIWDFEHCGEI